MDSVGGQLREVEVETAEKAKLANPFVITVAACIQQPQSRGSITLASPNFRHHPLIDPNYLHHPRDVQVIVKGLEELQRIMGAKALAHLAPTSMEAPVPGCEDFKMWSHEYLECLVRTKAMTLYHPTSTCRMGNDPKLSVVDSRLRVHGVAGLRVADASVFPDIVSGNTNLPAILIGEIAADLLAQDKAR